MTADALDPLIHVPAGLQIMATSATSSDGDALSFARLTDLIGLTPGNLITHLRKLQEAGYHQREDREWTRVANLGRADPAWARGPGDLADNLSGARCVLWVRSGIDQVGSGSPEDEGIATAMPHTHR